MTGGRKALIVAGDTYEHEGLRRLRSPQADAAALAAVLSDPQIGGFDVRVVRNQPSYEVQAQLEDLFADSRPDDLLLLHFACHGVKNEAGELYFAARNTRLDRLASTAVSADFVQRGMRASRSRSIVLLLDCCYGGAFSAGVSVRATGPVNVLDSFSSRGLDGGRGRAVITASNAMEYAFEGDTLADDHTASTSVFTDALVRGLSTGEADRDEDGWVSLNELYDYVFDRVRTTTPGQTPTRDVEMQGELYLARSRRRRVKAAPLPPDLLAASTDGNMFTRLGAVSELRARLLGDNLPSAAGAYARLKEIADGDIRYVADAASAALVDASLGVTHAELSFGDVPHGAEPPRRHVGLLGPPLARTCSLEPSDVRIGVHETADGFDVWVDTSRVGPVDGVVTVAGPTGEGRVAVRAVVTAQPDAGAPDAPAAPAAPAAATDTVEARVGGTEPSRTPPPAAPRTPRTPEAVTPGGAEGPTPGGAEGLASDGADLGPTWPPVAALLGAVLLAVGAALPYQWESTLAYYHPELSGHAFVMAALVAAAAVLALAPRTRGPVGTGLLVGVLASSTWGLATLWSEWWNLLSHDGGAAVGFWLMLFAHVVMLAAGTAAVRALARRPREIAGDPPAAGWIRPVLVVTGVLGAVALLIKAGDPAESEWDWTMSAWLAVLAAGLPLAGALARPARVGRWLLVGWVVGGGAVLVAYLAHHARLQAGSPSSGTAAVLAFGGSLAVLLAVTVVAARRDGSRAVPSRA